MKGAKARLRKLKEDLKFWQGRSYLAEMDRRGCRQKRRQILREICELKRAAKL